MTFKLYINTDNAAFAEGNLYFETARILREIAAKLESNEDDFSMYRTLFDLNGNDVGRAAFKDDA